MTEFQHTLADYVRPHRKRYALGVSLVLGSVLVSVASPFIVRFAIDELEGGDISYRRMAWYALGYLAAALVGGAFGLAMRQVLLSLSYRIEFEIRETIFAHLTRLDSYFFSRERTGDIMTKMTSDLNAVREFLGQGVLQGARTLMGFALAFGVMFSINVRLAAMMMLLLPCISLLFFLLLRIIRRRYEATQEQFSIISNFSQENFAGIRTIRGYGIEKRQRNVFRMLNEEYIRLKMALTRIERPLWPMMSLLFGLGVVALLSVGGRLVIAGTLSIGEFVQFIQYLFMLQWPMLALGWTVNLLQRGAASWKRIQHIMQAQPRIQAEPDTGEHRDPVRGDLEFEHVTLSLGGMPVLHDISFSVGAGETVGITGPTGAGKSILIGLVPRLFDPDEGCVRLDGRDVRDLPLAVLRQHIAMAPQEPFLFSDTLANNIAFGAPGADLEHIFHAADIAHLSPDVQTFPNRFETLLGERGVTLSGGQRQRTAISRALARSSSVLILDDVFSAIDTQTEAHIQAKLRPLLQTRTALIVSHRISTLRHADRIVVIENGRITQQGTHRDLLLQPGYYRDLEEMQRLEAQLESRA
jgi:ATP-binding cassette, subfamily B, multidrug efflux pump